MRILANLAGLRTKKTTRNMRAANEDSRYRGVEVKGQSAECCEASNALAGKRFLNQEAPMLPLNDCTASECRCRYEPFYDRRTDMRRSSDVGYDMASQFQQHSSRGRAIPGRRNSG